MLRKYLKYDFKAVLPIWWIAAVVLGGLSVLAGVCARILAVKDWENFAGIPWEIFGIILFVMGIGAFSVITYVLVYLRYFNNFFGDEGCIYGVLK